MDIIRLEHNIIAYYRKLVNKIFCVMKVTVYFENRYGVKSYNKKKFSIPQECDCQTVNVNPSDIYLSFDALKDEYTHLDTSLASSPHVEMIQRIYNHEDITHSLYILEEIRSSLDGRFELIDDLNLIKGHIAAALSNKKSKMPLVYILRGRYYVLDGKHRLAASLIQKDKFVPCMLVPLQFIANDVYTQGVYRRMKYAEYSYRRNINHIKEILRVIDSQTN